MKNKINFLKIVSGLMFLSAISGFVALSLIIFSPVWAALGDYNRSEASLSVDDWNYLDSDFVLKEGDTMGGNINMNNIGLTGLSTNSSDPSSLVNTAFVGATVSGGTGGATYINWGRPDCAAGDNRLYSGFSFGGTYGVIPGSDNEICIQLPADAEFNHSGAMADRIYPSMSGGLPYFPIAAYSPTRSFIRCAVCYRANSACYINYGSHNCDSGTFTHKAYDGYVAADISGTSRISRERNCLNQNFDNSAGTASNWGSVWYGTRIEDNFGQAGYDNLTFFRCAVCCN